MFTVSCTQECWLSCLGSSFVLTFDDDSLIFQYVFSSLWMNKAISLDTKDIALKVNNLGRAVNRQPGFRLKNSYRSLRSFLFSFFCIFGFFFLTFVNFMYLENIFPDFVVNVSESETRTVSIQWFVLFVSYLHADYFSIFVINNVKYPAGRRNISWNLIWLFR